MPTTIPEQITLQSDELGDGCTTFNIYQAPTASFPTLITNITAAQLEEGFGLSGSNIHNAYYLECVDTNSVIRSNSTLQNCEGGVAIDDVVCPEPVTYSGTVSYPVTYAVDLGLETGSVSLDFQAYNVPDKFVLNWSGSTVINTGYRGSNYYQSDLYTALSAQSAQPETIVSPGSGTVSFHKSTPLPNIGYVQVYAPLTGTAWNLTIRCPDGVSDAVEEDEVIGNCYSLPTNGGSCLTGTTALTEVDDWPQTLNDVSFQLAEGSTAVVTPRVIVTNGYINTYAEALLTDQFDTVIQRFKMYQEQGFSTPSYTPSNYTLTDSGDYKLRVYSFPTENGNGCVSLYVTGCANSPNHSITAEATKTTSSGSVLTGLKVIISGVGMSSQTIARNLVNFLTGRTTSSGFGYNFSSNMQSSGFLIKDTDIPSTVGDISVSGASSISWGTELTETVVTMTSISGTGNLVTVSTGVAPLYFQQKN